MNYIKYLEENPDNIKLLDKVTTAQKTWDYVVTDFLTPDQQEFLKSLCLAEDVYVKFYGGCGEFERAAAVIGNLEYEGEYPIDILKIEFNSKFDKLTHRDYLGSILSLGIKREKIGDINVYEDGADIYISRDISDYILNNVTKIKHSGIKIKRIDIENARKKHQEYKELKVISTSLRLDCVISSIINISRNESASLIKHGDIKVNYVTEYNTSSKINENTIISVKGYGRFLFKEILGRTKSERLTLLVKKYL